MLVLILPTVLVLLNVHFTAEGMESPGSHVSGCLKTGVNADGSHYTFLAISATFALYVS